MGCIPRRTRCLIAFFAAEPGSRGDTVRVSNVATRGGCVGVASPSSHSRMPRIGTCSAPCSFADLRVAGVDIENAWGLDDFDDSTRGPAFIDIVRFLGSIDLATRQRGWARDREALWSRFFEGYHRGLSEPDVPAPEPAIVHYLRQQTPLPPAAYLAWGIPGISLDPAAPPEAQLRRLAAGRFAVGSPVQVVEALVRQHRAGVTHATMRVSWPGMPQAEILAGLELLGREVLPEVRRRTSP